MATDEATVPIERASPETVESTVGGVKRTLLVGVLFVAVGYPLVVGALVLEVTQFHPLVEECFAT